ncbi:MAG: hypothetical protein IJ302_05255 [Clostridia bacterium]|nr:hypothetical protein [Clostridia bacterium]
MNRLIKILRDALLYWLQIIIFIWPSFFVGNGFVGLIVRLLLNHQDRLWVRISETLACVFVLCALLFVFAYKRGYKKAEFHGISLLISLILAVGLQLIYATLFRYAEYTTAGAYYFAHLLYAGSHQEMSIAYYDVPAYLYIIAMLVIDPFYITAVISGEYLGKKKRLKERAALNLDKKA